MDINIDATKDKVIINFKPMLVRTTRMESSLVTEDIKSKRPVRNVIYTVFKDHRRKRPYENGRDLLYFGMIELSPKNIGEQS